MTAPYFLGRHGERETRFAALILPAAILLLPTLFPEKIGWLTSLVPLPFFYFHVSLGRKEGFFLTRNAVLLAAGCSLLFGSLPMLVFSLTLVPLGITFSYGVFDRRSPVVTGFIGSLVLAAAWLLYWSGLSIVQGTNPYTTLLADLDKGLSNGLLLYEKSADLAPDTLAGVRKAVELLRTYIPKILPGMLISALLGTVWLNLALGNWLLRRKDREITPWPAYKEWKVPDHFVWLVILSGAMVLLLPRPLKMLGLNGLIVCGTVYFFQGLAIAASLLNRWSVPGLFRVLIYALIFIQTYGIILMSFLGLLDVWADFRKLNRPTGDSPDGSA